MRLGIDIDGTVTCPASLIPHINRAFNSRLTLNDIKEYDLTKALPKINPKTFSEWFESSEAEIYEASPMNEDADTVLKTLQSSHELIYISARGTEHQHLTKEWFYRHDIHFDKIVLTGSHNKLSAVKDHRIDLFLEDKHDNAVDIHEDTGIPVLLFDAPYNRAPHPEGVIRISSWHEAKSYIQQFEKKLSSQR
ncbi:nucleotidase [Jeotgalibacillus malaysiensis]|uniref:Nucleotidase n=1 Tax=Jeotgalibacillus malaysiensis TaxID=1508404 RepID=A0A0B5ASE1_9BACL|nr:nucleotidase [Jeotgalibacillus malaysiensis]AJD91473.1 nucleotidase [Jeotgalibacillus malaysiensis]